VPGEFLFAGERLPWSVAAFRDPILQNQEDLVMERNVAAILRGAFLPDQGGKRLHAPRSITQVILRQPRMGVDTMPIS
jgi:hypothetical protein